MSDRLKAAPNKLGGRFRTDPTTIQFAPAANDEAGAPKQPTFDVDIYGGGPIFPQSPWLDAGLILDLEGMTLNEPLVAFLEHDDRQIVGQTTSAKIDSKGVHASGIVTGDPENENDPAYKVVQHAKRGFQWRISADGSTGPLDFVAEGSDAKVNGKTHKGPVYIARSPVLDGFSFLAVGADRTANATIAASAAKETDMEFHEWLKAKGFDPTTIDAAQRDSMLKLYQMEGEAAIAAKKAGRGDKAPTDVETALAATKLRGERKALRCAIIQEWGEKHEDDSDFLAVIEATGNVATEEDWTPEKLKLELHQNKPTQVNNRLPISKRKEQDLDAGVYEAGLYLATKQPIMPKMFTEQQLDAASRQWKHGLSLMEFLRAGARTNGFRSESNRDLPRILAHALPSADHVLRGSTATSGMDVAGILSNVANKFILQQFMAIEQAWREIASIRPVNDFKQISSYSLTGDLDFKLLPPGGEMEHMKLGETSYVNQARTYARIGAIDRRDMINDDLGAFQGVMARLGRGGGMALNKHFWGIFLDNSAFFTSGRGNLKSGADTAFDILSLEAAEAAFAALTDPDGNPLGLRPSRLLVPTLLRHRAGQAIASPFISQTPAASSGTIAASNYGTTNTFQGAFKVVNSDYMGSSQFTGYSTASWYLLADPADLAVIQMCFLNGVETPTVEGAQADFETLGVKMRGFFDFGAALQEYRGGIKMAGS